MTDESRTAILSGIRAATERLWDPRNAGVDAATRRAWFVQRDELFDRYFESLPWVSVARCPHCGQVASLPMDLDGLDGLWWLYDNPGDDRFHACGHLMALFGALHFQGHVPSEAITEAQARILPGPEVPYVVPRLLAVSGTRCVLSSVAVAHGRYRAYLAAYFVETPLDAPPAQCWLREDVALPGMSTDSPRLAGEGFDYNVGGWIESHPGLVAWLAPDAAEAVLHFGSAECPYLAVSGRRHPIEVTSATVARWAAVQGATGSNA